MIAVIEIMGLASKSIVKKIPVPSPIPENLSLMNFLISNKITIASSCNGVGSCQKCIVNKSILSCQLTLSNFIKMTPSLRVEISYL